MQPAVTRDIAQQIVHGEERIFGIMLESHLLGGRQNVVPGEALKYGQSITDACMDWEISESLIIELAEAVRKRRK